MPKTWRHGFVPLSPERVVVTGEPGFTNESKQAFQAGRFTIDAGLPLPPPPAHVTFPDGAQTLVRLVTAEDALVDMRKSNGNTCDHPCQPLEITRIVLGTVTVLTTRGNATVPAWQFSVTGLRTSIAYMAVDDRDVSQIPAAPAADYPAMRGLVSAQNTISVDGATVRFTIGVGTCDKDIKPQVYETADTVAVGGSVATPDAVCDAMLKLQPVTVVLAKSLGDRALIDGLSGRPLTVNPLR